MTIIIVSIDIVSELVFISAVAILSMLLEHEKAPLPAWREGLGV